MFGLKFNENSKDLTLKGRVSRLQSSWLLCRRELVGVSNENELKHRLTKYLENIFRPRGVNYADICDSASSEKFIKTKQFGWRAAISPR